MPETCMIVDGHSLMYRAFHALPPMDANGVHTNALHGFLSMLLKVLKERKPNYCVVAFDEHGPTFRHRLYPQYKAGRPPMPDELREQFPIVRELLKTMGIGVIGLEGYEADDLIGSVSRQCGGMKIDCLIVTGDRDALQLVDERTSLIYTRRGITDTLLFTPDSVKEHYGISPKQVPDWKSLTGDASDNIPGVPGIGDKTAVRLLNEYGSLAGILAMADSIPGKTGERLRAHAETAEFSRQLATIDRNAPVQLDLGGWGADRLREALPALSHYRLISVSDRIREIAGGPDLPDSAALPSAAEEGARELADPRAVSAFLDAGPQGPLSLLLEEGELTLTLTNGRSARILLPQAQQSLLPGNAGFPLKEALGALSADMQRRGIATHDAKRFFHRLGSLGLPIPPLFWDTLIAAYLHNPLEKIYALAGLGENSAAGVRALSLSQASRLREDGMEDLFTGIELPLVRVLYDMEAEGFQVDRGVLVDLGSKFSARMEELREEIYASTGVRNFNLNSPRQLSTVLYDTLGLPAGKKTQTGSSTDADTLEGISHLHPAIPLILEYRQVGKLNGTYIEGLLGKITPRGRIHSTFDQTGTSTGRISSSEPNLQNIPIRTALGRDIRRAFTAKEGHLLVDADYSQIELRVLAHMSGDSAMCDAFLRGQDIHARTAAEINGIPMDEVTPELRSAAKAVNFGIVYGISDYGLARNIGTTQRRAADFISRYFDRYPGVHSFMQQAVRDGYSRGYVATLYGRRRPLPELSSSNQNIRSFGERAAMNTPIQGTAADIIKAAMVRVHERLQKGGFRARLILQVHDELLIEAPEAEVSAVSALLKDSMEHVLSLRVPLVCDVKTGPSWYDSK